MRGADGHPGGIGYIGGNGDTYMLCSGKVEVNDKPS